MHYRLYQARDKRDGVTALWLRRAEVGGRFDECAYLGKAPKEKDLGVHCARIKQVTNCRTNFYVFEGVASWVSHHDAENCRLLGDWEASL